MQGLLSTKEAAEKLGLSPGTLEVWRCLGKGPRYIKIGRRVGYDLKDLDAYVESCKVLPLEEMSDLPRNR
ncbi:AlpA family transcriptional regulator [Desulfovibrio sp. JC022]|uniref:helix-turn-helix transcriptional regulator n=1 Tax=Desulfovibrio sp. JC022 TaxID=2593642 RepID=UPI0013D77B33|nr:helix-turn-helix domain-containing protein [Desulfovibrio sp. JC022]NDV23844.1 helix-turn-helix domain-containing protein [Desulfovibrio sp. JC022]